MGFFSFIKDAGEKLFSHKEAEATAAAAAATDDAAAKEKLDVPIEPQATPSRPTSKHRA